MVQRVNVVTTQSNWANSRKADVRPPCCARSTGNLAAATRLQTFAGSNSSRIESDRGGIRSRSVVGQVEAGAEAYFKYLFRVQT